MASVRLEGVELVHADGTTALAGVDLEAAAGELLVLCGPSGSGKTSVLRLVAGLDAPTAGHVLLDDAVVDHLPAGRRDVAMVTQEHPLLTHLDVGDNLGFALKVRRTPEPELTDRVTAEARAMGIGHLLRRRPRTLSAGSRQRTALGKVTVRPAAAYLMDEPLAHLDPPERLRLRTEILRIQHGLGVTTLYATHEQPDALALADILAILREGRVEQVGPPAELLARPVNTFVAEFLGSPGMALVEAAVEDDGGLGTLVVGGQRLRVPGGLPGPLKARAGGQVLLGVRPAQVRDARDDPGHPADQRLTLRVERSERLGHEDLVRGLAGAGRLVARFPPGAGPPPGTLAEVTVDVAALHAFDPATGAAIWHGR